MNTGDADSRPQGLGYDDRDRGRFAASRGRCGERGKNWSIPLELRGEERWCESASVQVEEFCGATG